MKMTNTKESTKQTVHKYQKKIDEPSPGQTPIPQQKKNAKCKRKKETKQKMQNEYIISHHNSKQHHIESPIIILNKLIK